MRVSFANLLDLLQESAWKKDVVAGRAAYSLIVEDGLYLKAKLICLLIKMFAACGNIFDALNIFNTHEQNVYTWSCIILAHAHHGYGDEALLLYHQMQISCIKPNTHTFVAIIKACNNSLLLDEVYSDITTHGLEKDSFVGNCLVDKYARHGNLVKAREIFDQLSLRDATSWSAIITGYTNSGYGWEAVDIFHQMWHKNPSPDEVTFLCILRACASVRALTDGRLVHVEITKWFELGVFIGSTLIDMYGKCNCIEEARKVFDCLPVQNLVCWNAIIAGYVSSKLNLEALHLLDAMQHAGFEPNEITYTAALKACSDIPSLKQGMQFHERILRGSFEGDSIIGSCLVDFYVQCGSMPSACMVFDNLGVRSTVTWTAIIAGHVECGNCQKALEIYHRMRQKEKTKLAAATFLCVLKACISVGDLDLARVAYIECIEEGLDSDVAVGGAVVDAFAKSGNISCAKKFFALLPVKSVVSYSAVMSGLVQQGHCLEAFTLLGSMQREGISPNEVTFICLLKASLGMPSLKLGRLTHMSIVEQSVESVQVVEVTLVAMYSKSGNLLDAQNVFDGSETRDVILWTAMIAGYSEFGNAEEALHLYERMHKDGIQPNEVTFACILKACATLASLDHGRLVHREIMKQGLQFDLFVGNSLVGMFAKCGNLQDARRVFDALHVRDVISWSAMIEGYANHGHSHLALKFFHLMRNHGFKPVDVTYISVLSACCNTGLINECYLYFMSMNVDYDLTQRPEHYACLVDLLGRAGQLKLAEGLVLNMPIQSDPVVWIALLGSCARLGDVELGIRSYNALINLDTGNTTAAVLLSNIFAANLMWEDARRLENLVSCGL
ncbi:hypothetical protein GOP47_0017221 [Adiantum capillus-veneris]|uniref:Pentatricopeptide repeat-containing protein n=1 Tax=Adiantum capillus-veneris TaxID=13818 RepID=A0A9D4ZDR5_ADICA|nr:hypothetical protein GOP47_0017221 [Adiantum capillus-veneris]